ncbi:alpha-amylase, partial [Bacteroidales bacterium OttesenSCG-928-M11]|nr:alpha-amylase [Bacteroidales bacterium OttesenSCG-928-M11]
DKVGLYDTLKAIVQGSCPAHRITQAWQSIGEISDKMLHFLENHDEQRIASPFFAGDAQRAIPALFVSALFATSPFMIYFGQELGEAGMDQEGFSGQDGRTTIFDYWSVESIRNERAGNLTEQQQVIKEQYLDILRLCSSDNAIRKGLFYDVMYVNFNRIGFNPDKQYAFLRFYGKEVLLIVANFDSSEQNLNVFLPDHAFEYFGKSIMENGKDIVRVEGGYECLIRVKANNGFISRLKVK